jgi:hypothetical protein
MLRDGVRRIRWATVRLALPTGHEHPNATLNRLVASVRATGAPGVIGAFVPQDRQGVDEMARHGQAAFDFDKFWLMGQRMGTGQAHVKHCNRYRRDLVHEGGRGRRGSFRMNWSLMMRRRRTSTSTRAKRAGRKSP